MKGDVAVGDGPPGVAASIVLAAGFVLVELAPARSGKFFGKGASDGSVGPVSADFVTVGNGVRAGGGYKGLGSVFFVADGNGVCAGGRYMGPGSTDFAIVGKGA
jgi:hypothetical protein